VCLEWTWKFEATVNIFSREIDKNHEKSQEARLSGDNISVQKLHNTKPTDQKLFIKIF
jgi:hypothetical protein